ncbi:MAG: hypothetical protein R6W31_01100 [Bacteroidales bacterium]
MKKSKMILLVAITMIAGGSLIAQKGKTVLNTNQVPEVVHVNLDDFPKDQVLPMIHGWGGLTVDVNNLPKGTDFKPLLEGLENDHCQVPHWGYVVKGAILIEYEDGGKDLFREGEAFYMKPGHTGEVMEDLQLVSFSPEEGMHDLAKHLEKRVAELQAQSQQ